MHFKKRLAPACLTNNTFHRHSYPPKRCRIITVSLMMATILLLIQPTYGNYRRTQQQQQQQRQKQKKADGYYSALGITKKASKKDIKAAYRKLALQYHPDKVKDESKKEMAEKRFREVSEAYAILSDEEKRKVYDKYGKNGLDALEKGIDPEQAGFGGGGGFGGGFPGGFPGGGGGNVKFNFGGGGSGMGGGFDPFSMFEDMFGGAGGGGGGFPGGGGANFNFGGGGFSGGGGGGGGGGGQRRQQQQQQQPPPDLFPKDPSGLYSLLGKAKFPDSKSKNAWLVFLIANSSRNCQQVAPTIKKLAEANKGNYKIGIVNCERSQKDTEFCMNDFELSDMDDLPAAFMIVDGKKIPYEDQLRTSSIKALHDFANSHMPFDLVQNVNHQSQIVPRLTGAAISSKKMGAVLLLTDKYDTSPMYAALAYRFKTSFIFGESRAKNLGLAKEFSVKKYPLLVAFIPRKEDDPKGGVYDLIKYDGAVKLDDIAKWIDGLSQKFSRSGKTKTQRR